MIKEFVCDGSTIFHLKNDNLSCMLRIVDEQLELLHFGQSVMDEDASAFISNYATAWGTSTMYKGKCLDCTPLAWGASGLGDFRESPFEFTIDNKPAVPLFRYTGAEITDGIYEVKGLPQAKGECESLLLGFKSKEIEMKLVFTIFETALTRRTLLKNVSDDKTVFLTKCMSQMMDVNGDYDILTLDGGWISEAHVHKTHVTYSKVVNESLTGFSSHKHNPGFLLYNGNRVYGFNLIYSGNHYASAQKSAQNLTRVMQGINPDNFVREIKPDEEFASPEAVITFSDNGFNGQRANMHKFINEHIVPAHWQYRERPILFNDWEGCMFDFNEKKLLSLARQAKDLGCELFVLDDGWFSTRDSDSSGLGDYDVNTKKLPNGLTGLSNKIHKMGMQFGLWFEPEAVNPDSKLFREHPDWAINTSEEMMLSRNELLLDLRKPEVRDYIVNNVTSIIDSVGIDYVKWDMNRHSALLGNDAHDYILGLYDVMKRIFDGRDNVLLENCASGGNRFDLGMMCFSPQIWASDDTDPIERLDIQEGLSYLYPQSVMGNHISESPHVQTLRKTPLSTRANVSFFGIFGLELDLDHLTYVDKKELQDTIEYYKKNRYLLQFGQFATIESEDGASEWQVTANGSAIVGIFHRLVHAAPGYEWLRAVGLVKDTVYNIEQRPQMLRVESFSNMVKYIAPINPAPDGMIVRNANRFYKMQDAKFTTQCSGAALNAGVPLNLKFIGTGYVDSFRNTGDFGSNVYLISEK